MAPAGTSADAASRPRNVRDVEREHIQAVLQQVAGNRKLAIAILGISERALRYKLKAYREQADEGSAFPTELTDNLTGSLP
jgi:two-component system response regulator FlrC